MAINFRGLTRDEFEVRWEIDLSSLGRAVLVKEAYEDCLDMVPREDIGLYGAINYTRMVNVFEGRQSWDILQEIHNRLAGERRHGDKNSSAYVDCLLAFVPPDQFVSPDDEESA